MKLYSGVNALAPFQQSTLLKSLKNIDNNITGISAEYIHFVNADALTEAEDKKISQLLKYETPYNSDKNGTLLLVLPRPGTISPWSSKATDIAKNCGLTSVNRIERGTAYYIDAKENVDIDRIGHMLHDRMTQIIVESLDNTSSLFEPHQPKTYQDVDIQQDGKDALHTANIEMGLALSEQEITYLYDSYSKINRNPSDVELMMFSVVNSEHCRHKIFNATWTIDGLTATKSLFKMIKNTYETHPKNVLSAYSDNAAVLDGPKANQLFVDPKTKKYQYSNEPAHLVVKVETHNHPTAIAPYPGASTGIGGEIRDEAATGRGARSKMGLSGFNVSNLNLPGAQRPWEKPYGKPDRIVSPLDIMIESPLGGSAFANEFGRPNLAGYFRTYEQEINGDVRGYHKPIMIAGGLGNIRSQHVLKNTIKPDDLLIVLGGPSMLIGLGGGSASSLETGKSNEDLDFASVQRGNAEMQRRAQEVISSCWSLGEKNPIVSIHDVGAGGISNALPELIHDNNLGGTFDLRSVPNAEPGLSPMEIWCNEAQERFVLAIDPADLDEFSTICERERCLFAVVGKATEAQQLVLEDTKFNNKPIDIPMNLLFGNPPKMERAFDTSKEANEAFDTTSLDFAESVDRVLRLPAVASKKFLITIGDRTVGGLTTRDQMIGPWQVPVSDVAVTASSYNAITGEAMAIGERPQLAFIDAAASARMAVGEVITNISAANIEKIGDIKLSANWMAAAGYKNEDQHLYEAVKALGEEFCVNLGICIPVGKDSLSMRSTWTENGKNKAVTSPMSVVITGFSPVKNTSKTITPQLQKTDSSLILIDLGKGKNRLGGSALAQVYSQLGDSVPDIEAGLLKKYFTIIQQLNNESKILSYHDRSDGGLFTTIAEMSFAGRKGVTIDISELDGSAHEILWNEELGAVIEVDSDQAKDILQNLNGALDNSAYIIGKTTTEPSITINNGTNLIYKNTRAKLEQIWAETSYHMQKLRDNPAGADSEFAAIAEDSNPGISPHITFEHIATVSKLRPKVAILREQGVNGHTEMAAAFDRAGFDSIDVHMTDLASGKQKLDDFSVMAVCGGFSYGDVLGAGNGFNKSILFNDTLRKQFETFFHRKDTLSLGVCNGCQMLSGMKSLIPGAAHWPRFLSNTSGRFEARLATVKINKTPSILLKDMEQSIIPVPVAHGEGRAVFDSQADKTYATSHNLIAAEFVDNFGQQTEAYPYNPNGSEQGITALTSEDGRATILMPHPERVFLTKQFSWHPDDWSEDSPWMRMFQNARKWFD